MLAIEHWVGCDVTAILGRVGEQVSSEDDLLSLGRMRGVSLEKDVHEPGCASGQQLC